MRNRHLRLTLASGLSIVIAACSSGGATTAPLVEASVAPSVEAPVAPSTPTATQSTLKIGVVTEIGSLNDESSFKGAVEGATKIGAPAPQSTVPKDASEYKADIQAFVDQKYNIIVTVGFNLTADTVTAAKANPHIHFVGVDQSPVCVDEQGNADPTFSCKGDAKTVLPNYTSLYFAEDQAGYLAGIVAAFATKTGSIGAIGGTTLCTPCVRYIQGYELGARANKPDIKVAVAYVTNDLSAAALNDPAGGKAFAQAFLKVHKPDVVFAVGGKTGNGVLEAACAAGIYGIGVDVDQWVSLGVPANACIITSAEKHVESAVKQAITGIAAGTLAAGDVLFSAANIGVGVSGFQNTDKLGNQFSDARFYVNTALDAMRDGSLKTCPETGCGVYKP